MNNNVVNLFTNFLSIGDSNFDALIKPLSILVCEICGGYGHTPFKCPSKKKIDTAVKFHPSARILWKAIKRSKAQENIKARTFIYQAKKKATEYLKSKKLKKDCKLKKLEAEVAMREAELKEQESNILALQNLNQNMII